MENKTYNASFGIKPWTLWTIVFVVLKLVGVITWSWIWVLAPLWIGVALVALFFVVGVAIYLISR